MDRLGILRDTNIRKRLMSGVFFSFCGSLLSRVLMLGASLVVSREIGREAFGEYGIIQSTIIMLSELVGIGVGVATTKHLSEFRSSDPAKAANLLSLNIVVGLAFSTLIGSTLYLASDRVAKDVFDQTDLSRLLQIAAVNVFFGALASAQLAALAGFERFKIIANISVVVALISATLQIILVRFYQLTGVFLALCFGQLISLLLGATALRSNIRSDQLVLSWHGARSEIRSLVAANLPILLSNILVVPTNWFCNVMLVNQVGGMSQMGIYNAVNQWKMAFLNLPSAIASVVFPMLTRIRSESGTSHFKQLILINLGVNAAIGTFAVTFCFLFGSAIMAGYGPEFSGTQTVLEVIAIVALFMSINNVIGQVIASRGKFWVGVVFNFAWALTLILAAFLLIPRLGAMGLAIAGVIAYGLHTLWQMIYVRYLIKNMGDQ